jgi:hypothetical protein
LIIFVYIMKNKILNKEIKELSNLIKIKKNSLRSINIESDITNYSILEGYVLTAQARSSLNRIITGLQPNAYSRAWTLTGPFGSGKSFFSLYLINLLSKFQFSHDYSRNQLRKVDPILDEYIGEICHLDSTKGFIPIAISGRKESLQICIKHGLLETFGDFSNLHIDDILERISSWTNETSSRFIIKEIDNIQKKLSEKKYTGIIFVIDELGKTLEYVGMNSKFNDISLLQEVAEYSNRSRDPFFIFIGILHQAFERYAAFLDSKTQNEWSKIHGRFEDIAFQEPPNQQMYLIASAVEHDTNLDFSIYDIISQLIDDVVSSDWRPPMIKHDEYKKLCLNSYPLHPTTLSAFPYVFRRLAQNERSIFAYLASFEPYGFQELLHRKKFPEFIRIPDLFDYIIANFQSRLFASGGARTLLETLDRLGNLVDMDQISIDIIKTIGLLNWLGEVSQLKATNNNVQVAIKTKDVSKEMIDESLQKLQDLSVITYRRYNKTYAIWQGSDINLDEKILLANKNLSSSFSIAEEIQRYIEPNPIVARRHSYTTGTLRYFGVQYIDNFSKDQFLIDSDSETSGYVLLCIATNLQEYSELSEWAQSNFLTDPEIIMGIIHNTSRIAEYINELRCIYWVQENTPELFDDQVARRELQTRLGTIESLIIVELEKSFSLHNLSKSSNCVWYYRGGEIRLEGKSSISHLLSNICDNIFPYSPRIWNELINRNNLSSQGSAARRNLIEAMLLNSSIPMLGITGYPPERSMYESILLQGGLHIQSSNDVWKISNPSKEDPLNLLPTWEFLSDFVFSDSPKESKLNELFDLLKSTPYGLSEGILPVILCVFYLVNKREITLYYQGSLIPDPQVSDWEILIKRPELFNIVGCRVIGAKASVITRLSKSLGVEDSVMSVVRELMKRLNNLPQFAWNTHKISVISQKVRSTIQTAHSPEILLFHDLPVALDLSPFEDEKFDPDRVILYFERLNYSLQEISSVTPQMRENVRDEFLKLCNLPIGEYGWSLFIDYANEMITRTRHPDFLPILKHAVEADDPELALDRVLAYIAQRPLRNWTDADVDRFPFQADKIGEFFKREFKHKRFESDSSKEQKDRSKEIASHLYQYLSDHYSDNLSVIQAALLELLERYKNNK